MAGGAVAGAISGAFAGGLEGALKGALIGGALGAFSGYGYSIGGYAFVIGMAAIGAGYAAVTGGSEGLANFAAGTLGSIAGATTVNALVGQTTVNTSESKSASSTVGKDPQIQEVLSKSRFELVDDYFQEKFGLPSASASLKGAELLASAAQTGQIGNAFYSGILAARKGESFAQYYTRFKQVHMAHFAYSEAFGLSASTLGGELTSSAAIQGGKALTASLAVKAFLNPRAGVAKTVNLFRAHGGFIAASKIGTAGTGLLVGATTYRGGLRINAWLSYKATYVW